jgi:hypothetical protein
MQTIGSQLISTNIVPVIAESPMDMIVFSLAFISTISTMKNIH